ncbi:chitin deacetylase [Tumebacillus sp. BK434]|uniref:polysaccharide deacetylase family protein n=1 Tax=Tumebacillus sp. BK434 TaxID=2512169 RepID=UPI0010F2F9D9|nr:polysaccharide deacetylase family protein [Tumebacillus sp. BK434]TCP59621.1 chitin deacetylase [Tumebacillus sp. BK434]
MKKGLIYGGIALAVIFALNVLVFFAYNRPPDRALFLDPVTHFETEEKVIALTFDDGPTREWTAPLLDLLKEHEVKATFFMIGDNIKENEDIARRAVAEGHQAANHTEHHNRMIYKSPQFIKSDLRNMDGLLKNIEEQDRSFFRPPYGDKMVVLPWMLKQRDMKLVTWDIDPQEQYAESYDPKLIVEQILADVHPGGIIILHDGRRRDPTAFLQVVDDVVTKLKADGYRLVTVKEGLQL